jgi:hypothetical protein
MCAVHVLLVSITPRPRSLARAALVANTSCFVLAPIAGRPTSARVIAFLADLNAMAGFGSVRATASEDGTTVTIEQSTVPAGGWGTVEDVLNRAAHFPVRTSAAGSKGGSKGGPKAHACGNRFSCAWLCMVVGSCAAACVVV